MPALTDNLRGALLMMASMASFTLNDTMIKSLAGEMPLLQTIFLRGIATSVLLIVLARGLGGLRLDLSRRDWGLIGARALAEIGATYFFLSALFNMPIANATAILQILPLTVTLAGALFLGEAVGWRRLLAILIGLAGVLLIVRPGTDGFTAYSVYALISVAFVTARDLLVRRLSPSVPSITVALSGAIAVTIFAGVASTGVDWAPLSPHSAVRLASAAVLLIGGYLFSVMAMRAGEVAVVSPFRYTGLVWALVLGILVFGEWPDSAMLAGAAIVVATGIFTFYRERRIARRAVLPLRIR